MNQLPDTANAKKQARAERAGVRRTVAAVAGADCARTLGTLAPCLGIGAGSVVAGYWPMGDEIDPRPLMTALTAMDCILALPVVVGRAAPLSFRRWAEGEMLEAGAHGTAHPPATAPEVVPAVVLVPLLGFDRRGFRLGYGGGYYDRTLERLRANAQIKAVGLAFAAQEMAEVPRDGHDQRLDGILTELGLIKPETA